MVGNRVYIMRFWRAKVVCCTNILVLEDRDITLAAEGSSLPHAAGCHDRGGACEAVGQRGPQTIPRQAGDRRGARMVPRHGIDDVWTKCSCTPAASRPGWTQTVEVTEETVRSPGVL